MATITVGLGGDFPTLNAAAKAVKPGDEVYILSGIYKDKLAASVERVTWQPAEGAAVVIDGGWNGKVVTGFMNQVAASAPGVVIRGLTIRNSPGRGIGVSADDVQILNNRIDRTYHGGMIAGDAGGKPVSGLLIEGNVMTRMSQSFVTEKTFDGVNGSFNILNVRDSVIRGNVLSDGWGEGINVGRGSQRVLVVGNVVHTMNHVLAYLNHCIECELRGNFLYHIPDPAYQAKDGDYSAGIVLGDERSIRKDFEPQRGNRIVGNVVVGAGKLLQVRNGTNPDRGYDTQLIDTEIVGNTFVAGPGTRLGIVIQPNRLGRPHQNSVFRDNVVEFEWARADAEIGEFSGPGVAFLRNGWSEGPSELMCGAGDVYDALGLARPDAAIERANELPGTSFDAENYRPVAGSPLVGKSSTGGTIGALAAVDEPPDEPDEPPADEWVAIPAPEWARIMEAARANQEATAALVGLLESIV